MSADEVKRWPGGSNGYAAYDGNLADAVGPDAVESE
jgi:hypothetical protein